MNFCDLTACRWIFVVPAKQAEMFVMLVKRKDDNYVKGIDFKW